GIAPAALGDAVLALHLDAISQGLVQRLTDLRAKSAGRAVVGLGQGEGADGVVVGAVHERAAWVGDLPGRLLPLEEGAHALVDGCAIRALVGDLASREKRRDGQGGASGGGPVRDRPVAVRKLGLV